MNNPELDYFKLMRRFWDYSFENPDKIKPNHIAIYTFAVEHCNRLGWKEKFGFPTMMVCEAIGIKSVTTFIKSFEELLEMGLITAISRSKNQYSSNVISLILDKSAHQKNGKQITKHMESTLKALDRARGKHVHEHAESTLSIIKHNTINLIESEQVENTPHPVNVIDLPPDQRKATVMQMLSTSVLTQDQKEAYYLKIEANDFTKSRGKQFVPVSIASVRADAELNARNGWINTSTNQSPTTYTDFSDVL
jgi:hypothetical protein